jgi:hypothetical protein
MRLRRIFLRAACAQSRLRHVQLPPGEIDFGDNVLRQGRVCAELLVQPFVRAAGLIRVGFQRNRIVQSLIFYIFHKVKRLVYRIVVICHNNIPLFKKFIVGLFSGLAPNGARGNMRRSKPTKPLEKTERVFNHRTRILSHMD